MLEVCKQMNVLSETQEQGSVFKLLIDNTKRLVIIQKFYLDNTIFF